MDVKDTNQIYHQLGPSVLEPVSGDGTGDMHWKAACPLARPASAPDILISLITGYKSCIYKRS